MENKSKKVSPLLIIILLGAAFWGVVIGAWYWSSTPMSSIPIVIEVPPPVYIEAKANVDPGSTWIDSNTKAAYADFTITDVLIEGSTVGLDVGKQFLFIFIEDTTALTLNLGITVTVPPYLIVTCDLQLESYMNTGTWAAVDMIIASDIDLTGATTYSLEWLGNPLFVPEYDQAESQIFVVLEFDITVSPEAPAGSYSFSDLVIQLGDNL